MNRELICDDGMAMDYPEIGQAEEFSPEQFEQFFAATMRPLRSYICRVASNEMIADDILQESYIRLLSAPAMREAQRKSYLYRVATNLIMDHHRAESRQRYWLQWSVVPGEEVCVVERIRTSGASVLKKTSFVKRYLLDRGFDLDTRVPGSRCGPWKRPP